MTCLKDAEFEQLYEVMDAGAEGDAWIPMCSSRCRLALTREEFEKVADRLEITLEDWEWKRDEPEMSR